MPCDTITEIMLPGLCNKIEYISPEYTKKFCDQKIINEDKLGEWLYNNSFLQIKPSPEQQLDYSSFTYVMAKEGVLASISLEKRIGHNADQIYQQVATIKWQPTEKDLPQILQENLEKLNYTFLT